MIRIFALALIGAALAAAAPAADFLFEPETRWDKNPDTDAVCAAIQAECPALIKDGQIEADFAYDDLFDADGKLAGVRMVKSTGCKQFDEYLLWSERDFRGTFSKPGKSDLDDIRVELGAGVDRAKVRIARGGSTSASIGC